MNSFQSVPGKRAQAIGMLLFALIFWGVSFPLIKAMMLLNQRLVPGASGTFLNACILGPRFLLALPLLLLWGRIFPGPGGRGQGWTRGEITQGCWLGFYAAGGMLLQTDGLRFTAASTSAFLTQFSAILIPLWLAFRRRRRPGLRVLASCALVLVGVATLSHVQWQKAHFGRGEGETLLAAVFFVGQILALDNQSFAGNHVGRMTTVMFATLGLFYSIVAVAAAPNFHSAWLPWTSPAWVILSLLLAGVCTLGGFLVMNTWQPKIPATEAGLLYTVEPIFGSIFALFIPGLLAQWTGVPYGNEKATLHLLVGGGLITLANVLIHLPSSPTAQLPPHGLQP